MFKKNEFKAAMVRKELTIIDVAKALGIDLATLSHKLSGQSDFYRSEIEKLYKLLDLSVEEILKIFLPNDLRKSKHRRAAAEEKNNMMKFLSLVFAVIFGTVITTYAVIENEPPAFIAYVFGIITGICWAGIVFLYWLCIDDDEDEGDKHD